IQALEELGTEKLEPSTIARIKDLLKKEDQKKLIKDLKLAKASISKFLFELLNEK
ncbi:MAG: hypothetical protein JNM51_00540, partial [Bacteroidia bacterium]|nr:hypothetical protein [Bacteroidia bacterium]